jgi:hypothetical protein
VSLPGPGFGPWLLALLVFAAGSAIVGGAVRTVVRRWVPSWRTLGPVERLLLDVYLGGAAVYAVALAPLGLFGAATFPVLCLLAIAFFAVRAGRRGRDHSRTALLREAGRFLSPGPALALVAAAGLGLLELGIAIGVPTGNTYDASQLGTYTGLLLTQRSIPTSLAGAGLSLPVVYPQGVTVWMGTAQLLFALPAARTALLVTPLFFALVPLGAYALGTRWLGSDRAGVVLAATFALLASWTRFQVSGSYDFVASFPLLLLLVALSRPWLDSIPSWHEAVAFGLLAGYTAALSPVGVTWWLVALPIAAALSPSARWSAAAGRWVLRYAAAVGAAVLPILPSLIAVARGAGHLGFATSEPAVGTIAPVGLTGPQIVGYIDPFLFGPNATWLSPFPLLRGELAALLVVGLALLILRPASASLPRFPALPALALGGGASVLAWFLLEAAAGARFPATALLAPVTNGAELAELLSTVFVLVAAVPLLAAAGMRANTPDDPATSRTRRPPGRISAPIATLIVVALLVPGFAVTVSEAPAGLSGSYHDFGNVTADDFAMIQWTVSHLPAEARVLVDPGSAAEFLSAYDPSLRLLYPMVVGFDYPNATYRAVVSDLTNGTLNASGRADLLALGANDVAVTQSNSVLGAPFSPVPLLADPSMFAELFHEGDAYVFGVIPPVGSGTLGSTT